MKPMVLIILLLSSCNALQVKKEEEHSVKPVESRMDRLMKAQTHGIMKKLIGFASNFQKPIKGFSQKPDPAKTFSYTVSFKTSNRAGTISLEIKPEGEKYRYYCKIVIESLTQEETMDYSSLDVAEIIRQLRIVLGAENVE